MEIKTKNENGRMVITPVGCLDTAAAPEFDCAVTNVLANAKNILLDFSEVEFISSSAIRTIVALKKKLDACGGELALTNLSDTVNEVFDMTGLLSILTVI